MLIVLFFQWRIIQQLLNEIHMTQQHSAAAVSFKSKRIESITFGVFGLEQTQICFPFVANHLATSETANRNDHLGDRKVIFTEKNRGKSTRLLGKTSKSKFEAFLFVNSRQTPLMKMRFVRLSSVSLHISCNLCF